jgi:hypothetical protein
MKVYTAKFSNGLYIRNPYFSFDVEGGLTNDLNRARLLESRDTAERHAEAELRQCELYPKTNKAVAGCTYEIVEVKIVEV